MILDSKCNVMGWSRCNRTKTKVKGPGRTPARLSKSNATVGWLGAYKKISASQATYVSGIRVFQAVLVHPWNRSYTYNINYASSLFSKHLGDLHTFSPLTLFLEGLSLPPPRSTAADYIIQIVSILIKSSNPAQTFKRCNRWNFSFFSAK